MSRGRYLALALLVTAVAIFALGGSPVAAVIFLAAGIVAFALIDG